MTNTVAAYQALAAKTPTRPGGKGAWAGVSGGVAFSYCVEAVWYFGGFSTSFDTATLAGNYVLEHHGLDTNPATCKVGEFEYWTDHVALRTASGDLMVSEIVDSIAPGLGYMTESEYSAKMAAQKYRGHSPYFGDQTLTAAAPPNPMENDMKMVYTAPVGTTPVQHWIFGEFSFQETDPQVVANDESILTAEDVLVTPAVLAQLKADTTARRTQLIADIAAAVPAGGSNAAVLAAIASLSTLETNDEKAIVAQLTALPDAVRKDLVAALSA